MELKELGSVCDLQNGHAFKSGDYVESSQTVSLRMSNIRPGGKFDNNYNLRYLPDSFQEKYSNYIVSDGDLVIAMTDLANDPKILGVPTIVKPGNNTWLLNQRVGKLIIEDSSKANKKYLKYILNHPIHRNYYKMFAGGGLQINVGKKDILGVKIPLPPLNIQEHIANILDDAAALRDKTKQLLEEYDLLAQSVFLDLMKNLDGEKKSLAGISKINPRKSEIAKLPKDTVVTFLPMSSVSEKGEVELSDERTIKEVWTGYTYFSEDDVLFAKITPCMENGKSCIAKNLKNSIGFGSTEFHVLRPIEGVTNSKWLFNLIKTERFKYIAEANMRGSAGQKRVPTDFFSKFKIRVPSIETQNEFAEKIALIEQQKDLARQELKESEDLFNCLLQKAFKGELVPETLET